MGLCARDSEDGGYDICYGLALQRDGMVFVVEVFSASDRRSEAERRGLWFCNVADKAALHILLRLKACVGNGFQLSVTS